MSMRVRIPGCVTERIYANHEPLHEAKTLLEALYAKDSKHAHYQTLRNRWLSAWTCNSRSMRSGRAIAPVTSNFGGNP